MNIDFAALPPTSSTASASISPRRVALYTLKPQRIKMSSTEMFGDGTNEFGDGHVVGLTPSAGFHALTLFPQKDEPTEEIASPATVKATPKKRGTAKASIGESPTKKAKAPASGKKVDSLAGFCLF